MDPEAEYLTQQMDPVKGGRSVAYIPAEWITQALGGEGLLAIAMATLVGVPAYLNGYAALPLVSGLIG